MVQTGTTAIDKDLRIADLSSNELEERYSAGIDLAHRKKFGQFFTPYSVARFMSQWIIGVSASNAQILDPCAGLGVFERALCSMDPVFAGQARFTLWEKDEDLAADLSEVCVRLAISHSVISKDFVNVHEWSSVYDGIIANPPYYKHHYVANKEGVCDVMSSKTGTLFSVQTNIYCWFLVKALALLKPGGRLAFIIPSEFLNANYGRQIKKHLLDSGFVRHIIAVCYRSKTFDNSITTACVLLAEKGVEPGSRLRFYRAGSHEQLDNLPVFLSATDFIEYAPSDLDIERKWHCYFPGNKTGEGRESRLVPFSTYGRFSRGIATGANEFFAVRPSTAHAHNLPQQCLIPCISKARQAPGKAFTGADFQALVRADKPVYLFDGNAVSNDAVDRYVRSGEKSGYQHRYLTRMRTPWYALEKRSPCRIWVGVFCRTGIRFIWNESDCLSLTCFHGFQPGSAGLPCLPFLFLYLKSSTAQEFLELEKREYGGGLEKYEPNDINNALAPDFSRLGDVRLNRLSALQRSFLGAAPGSAEEESVLEEADDIFAALV